MEESDSAASIESEAEVALAARQPEEGVTLDAAVDETEREQPVLRRPEITRDTSFFIGGDTLTTLFGMVSTIVLTRIFLEEQYGLWVFILAIYQTWFMFVDLGIPTVMVRDIPRGRTQSRQLLHKVIRLQLLVCMVLLPIGTFGALALWAEPGWSDAFILLAVAGALPALSEAHRVTLRALGEARHEAMSRMLDRFTVALGMSLAWVSGQTEVLPYALAALSGPIVALAYAWLTAGRVAKRAESEPHLDEEDILYSNRELLWLALPYMFTLGMTPLISHLDKFLLKLFLDFEAVALFDIAWKVYAAGLTVATALRKSLLPVYGGLSRRPDDLGGSIEHALKLAKWLVPPGLLIGAAIGIMLIPQVFTERYSDSIPLFLILLGAWTLWALGVPFQVAVQATMTGWNYAKMMGAVVLIDLIFGLLLIPRLGVTGAAWSTVIAQLGMLCIAVWLSRGIPGVRSLVPMISLLAGSAIVAAAIASQVLGGQLTEQWGLGALLLVVAAAALSGWRLRPPLSSLTVATEAEREEE